MKKVFLLAAFAGLLGSTAIAGKPGDDKDKNKKTEKSCAGEKKGSCMKGEKACCKKKAEADKATDIKQ
jgi:hypothetical protein